MKLIVLIGLVIVCVAAALMVFRKPDERIQFTDFSWSLSGKTAPFEFRITNRVENEITVIVVLEADEVAEGHQGTKLRSIGLKKLELKLAPGQEKKVSGLIELLQAGDSATRVSYTLAIKEPNQSLEPTSPSVTPRADARVAPAGAVAHL
jgi:hypothetical protein